MKRTLSTVVALISATAGIMLGPVTAWPQQDSAVFSAKGEASAVKVILATPLVAAPSVGYALSEADHTPKAHGIGSVVEPGLLGRAGAYIFLKTNDIPLSAECFYPDPPGPVERNSSANDTRKGTGAGVAVCKSDDRPGNYAHSSVADIAIEGSLSLADVAATSTTGRDKNGFLVGTSTATVKGVSIGNVLKIDQILSSTSAGSGAENGSEAATAAVSIVGATVQGQHVAITERGVVVNQPAPGLSKEQAQELVNKALEAAGVSIRLLQSEIHKGDEPGVAHARSGGVMVSWTKPDLQKALSIILGESESVVSYRRPSV